MRSSAPGVCSDLHRRVLSLVGRIADEQDHGSIRLTGGTALSAYYLGHRIATTLEFAADRDLDPCDFAELLRRRGAEEGIPLERDGTWNRGHARLLAREDPDSSVAVVLTTWLPFQLAPPERTAEGIRVASFRNLASAALHEVSQDHWTWKHDDMRLIDVHAILTRAGAEPHVADHVVVRRFRSLLADVQALGLGVDPHHVGQGMARGFGLPLVERFGTQLLLPTTEEEVRQTLRICFDECARIVAERFLPPPRSL